MQLLSVLGTAAGAVAQVILIAFVGVVAAFFPREQPLLTPEALRPISRIANDIFLPFLSAAVLGARINGAALRQDWVLLPAGLFVTVLGYAVADVTALLARPSPALLPALRVAVAHPNAFALPLLLLRYLCERPVVNAEFGGDDEECLERGAAKLCVFLTAWHVIFWTYAYSTLERIDGGAGREASARLWLRRVLLQPNMIGVYAGVLIGVSPLRRLLFFGATPLRPLGLAVETLGEPVVATTVLIMAAALANGEKRRRRAKDAAEPEGGAARAALWFVVVKLVVIPAIGYPLVSLLPRLPGGELTKLVLLLELAMPGAQTVLVTLNALGQGHVAEAIAPAYLAQYLSAVLTLTAFTAWALLITYR